MRFFTISKAVRILFLGGVFLGIGMAEPVALACRINVPPGCWVCSCDTDCFCVCTQC
jgi:hypothetical protein